MALHLAIPGYGDLEIEAVLFDLNGTLARNGILLESTRAYLRKLGTILELQVISADTHGTLDAVVEELPLHAQRITTEIGASDKLAMLEKLGPSRTIAVGNGRNDVWMLRAAAIGMAILGPEGCAREALWAADVIYTQIDDALESLLNPPRLVASLRG